MTALTHPTWERYVILSLEISKMNIRDRRQIFHLMRLNRQESGNAFFPQLGITFSEFAVWHVLGVQKKAGSSSAS